MDFAQMGKLLQLAGKFDLDKVTKLAEKVDLAAVMDAVSTLSEQQLKKLMTSLAAAKGQRKDVAPPPIDGDFYGFFSELSPDQQALRQRLRTFMTERVHPEITHYWQTDTTPKDLLVEGIRSIGAVHALFDEDGNRKPGAALTEGMLSLEMARIDVSTATFFGVHSGLALWSVALGGSDEQRAEWIPKMLDLSVIGAFGLTEPKVGSGVAGGLRTTCRREGDSWVLNGEKKWIGNSTFSDFVVIWARDEADNQVKGFIVRKENPGYHVEKIMGKIALRAVENGHITLTDCRVPESDRLQRATSWRVTADILRATRAGVAWQAVGCAMGAYERALQYTLERKQFGRPVAHFQLVQGKLSEMLGHVTSSFAMCIRLAEHQERGTMTDEQASLAKMHTATACRRVVAIARDLAGGNGILLEHDLARFFCDAEAIYSYEGTHEINSLVVGRAVTGTGAFV